MVMDKVLMDLSSATVAGGSSSLWKSSAEVARSVELVKETAKARDWEGFGRAFKGCEWRTGDIGG